MEISSSFFQQTGKWLLVKSGFPSLSRRLFARQGKFALMFHGISARKYDHIPSGAQPHLCAAELDQILKWIEERFIFLTPQEFFETDKRGVLLTFDDGFSNNETNALKVLEQHNAPAIFFVATQHVTDPANWLPATKKSALKHWGKLSEVESHFVADFFNGMDVNQLRRCADHPLITIGSHTLSHPFLSQIDSDALAFELIESKRLLEGWTQKSVNFFAYPTGDYNSAVMNAVKSAGYRAAFAVDSRKLGAPAFEISRIGLYESGADYLSLKLSGLHRAPLSANKIHV